MKKLLIFLLLVFVSCSSSNSSNEELEPSLTTPFFDLLNSVATYKKLYNENPKDYSSLTKLEYEDWINSCNYYYFEYKPDSIIIPRLDYFETESTVLEKTTHGLKISFSLAESNYYDETEETLYSENFKTKMAFKYNIWVQIIKGSGYIELPDSNMYRAKVVIDSIEGSLNPLAASAGQPKDIKIEKPIDFHIESIEPICVEPKKSGAP